MPVFLLKAVGTLRDSTKACERIQATGTLKILPHLAANLATVAGYSPASCLAISGEAMCLEGKGSNLSRVAMPRCRGTSRAIKITAAGKTRKGFKQHVQVDSCWE